jgi:hypothetical protein
MADKVRFMRPFSVAERNTSPAAAAGETLNSEKQ